MSAKQRRVPLLIPRWLGWPIFALVMGFVLGGSVLWGFLYIPPEQYALAPIQQTQASAVATWLTKDASGFFTFWLVVVGSIQVLMFLTQLRFMRRGMDDATKAAEAATLSARAAVALELPVIAIRPDTKMGFDTAVEFGRERHGFYLPAVAVTNAGRTRAFPIEIAWGWTFGDQLPPTPAYSGTTSYEAGFILRPDVTDLIAINATVEVPVDAYDQIRGGSAKLWFYCCLTYLDFMDTKRTARFCWLRFESFGGGRWLRDETPTYNGKT